MRMPRYPADRSFAGSVAVDLASLHFAQRTESTTAPNSMMLPPVRLMRRNGGIN
jgi:hypothetical protein